MSSDPHVGAVLDDRVTAEAAVDDLRTAGLADGYLWVAVREPDLWVLEADLEPDVGRGIRTGIADSTPVGAAAGMTILALTVQWAGTVGSGGLLVAGGVTGALRRRSPSSPASPGPDPEGGPCRRLPGS